MNFTLKNWANEHNSNLPGKVIEATDEYVAQVFLYECENRNTLKKIILWLFEIDDAFDRTDRLSAQHILLQNSLLGCFKLININGACSREFDSIISMHRAIIQIFLYDPIFNLYREILALSLVGILNGYFSELLCRTNVNEYHSFQYIGQGKVTIAYELVVLYLCIMFKEDMRIFDENFSKMIKSGSTIMRYTNDFGGVARDLTEGKKTPMTEFYNKYNDKFYIKSVVNANITTMLKEFDSCLSSIRIESNLLLKILKKIVYVGVDKYLSGNEFR